MRVYRILIEGESWRILESRRERYQEILAEEKREKTRGNVYRMNSEALETLLLSGNISWGFSTLGSVYSVSKCR